jgi:hypothetical protein
MLPLLWHMRNCFDFNQEVFSGQFSYFNQGACRWVVGVHIAVADLAEDWQLLMSSAVISQMVHMQNCSFALYIACIDGRRGL